MLNQVRWVDQLEKLENKASAESGGQGFRCGFETGVDADSVLKKSSHVIQVHGAKIVPAEAAGAAATSRPEADGLFTTEAGQIVAVKTADCLPVLMYSSKQETVGRIAMAIHAGWRGFCAGIISNALDVAREQKIPAKDLHVIIGPAICAKHFEIGPEVVDALRQHLGDAANDILQKGVGDRWHADLQMGATLELTRDGVPPGQIAVIRLCTSEMNHLPSYRRDGKGCGRLVSWIKLAATPNS